MAEYQDAVHVVRHPHVSPPTLSRLLIALVVSKRHSVDPQCIDDQRKRLGWLSATGVVQVKAAERLTPVLQYPDKTPFGQVRSELVLGQIGDA